MTARPRSRANGEGSIYPYKNGYAAYVWVTTPEGQRKRRVCLRQDPRGNSREMAKAAHTGESGTCRYQVDVAT